MSAVHRQLLIAGFTVLACGIMLLAIIVVGKAARNAIAPADRYQFPFNRIECPVPPGMQREAFLGEVRYEGQIPETVSILDEELPQRLIEAFEKHAWVETAGPVDIGPGKQIRVNLTFRTPVLAVVRDDTVRAVDAHGMLLPRGADTLNLPHLKTQHAPAGLGKPWGEPTVETAAAVAGLLHPHQARLKLTDFRYEGEQLRLRRGTAKGAAEVIWDRNRLPELQLERLLEQAEKLDERGGVVIDLRAKE